MPGVDPVPNASTSRPSGVRDDRVRLGLSTVDDRVARPDLEHLSVLPAESGTFEYVQVFLLVGMHMNRHRPLCGPQDVATQPDSHRSGGGGELEPQTCQLLD